MPDSEARLSERGEGHEGWEKGVWARRILIGAGALVLLLAAAALGAKMYFTPEKLASMVMPRLEQATSREVRVSTVRLDLFPRPAVRLEDVSLAAAPGFGPEPALTGEALDVQIALLPLLGGRMAVKRLRLVAPTVRYVVAPDGSHSFEGLGGDGAEEEPDGDGGRLALPASNFSVERGTVLYDDRRAGRGARFDADGTFSVATKGDAVRVFTGEGDLRIGSLRAMLPELREDSLRIESFRVRYDGALVPAADSLDFRRLGLEIDELRLTGEGALTWSGETPRVAFRFETGETDLEAFRRMVPRVDFGELRPRGRVEITGRAEGPLGAGALPDVTGEARVTDFTADYAGEPNVIEGASVTLTFSGDSVHVPSFEGIVLGRTFRVEADLVRGDPVRVRGRLNGEIDLERLTALRTRRAEAAADLEATAPRPTSGVADLDLTFRGTLGVGLAGLTFEGPARLSDVRYEMPALAAPLTIPSGTVRFSGSGFETGQLAFRVGETELTLTADVRNVLPLSRLDAEDGRPGARPSVDFRLESDRILLRDLLSAPEVGDARPTYSEVLKAHLSGERIDGQRPEEIAGDRFPLPSLPRLDATGEVRVGEVVNPPTRMEELTFRVRLEEGLLRVEDVRSGLYGGRFTGRVSAELGGDDRRSPVRFDVALEGSDAAAFMDRWTTLEDALTGTLDVSVAGRTFFDQTLLPVTEETNAEGRVMVRDGSLEGMVPMQGVVRAIGISSDSLARFDSLGGPFRVRQGRLELQDWRLDSQSGADGRAQGTVAFAGPLDLHMTLSLPLGMLEGSRLTQLGGGAGGLLGRFLRQATGSDEMVDVPLSIGGTMSDPSVRVDEGAFGRSLQSLLQSEDGARGLLRGLLGGGEKDTADGGGGLLQRLMGGAKKDTTDGGGG